MNALLSKPEEWLGLPFEDGKGFVSGLRSGGFEALEEVIALKKGFKKLKESEKEAMHGISSPKEFLDELNKTEFKNVFELSKHKKIVQNPNCKAYARKLREKIQEEALKDPTHKEDGKRQISIFAKSEIDLRAEEQQKKLDSLLKHGYTLCWLSSHANCSKRCAPWQGKLVDIRNYSKVPSFKMGRKVDGYEVYSLPSIMAQTDRYGYHNNIINGFNCRHHLIPYTKGSKPPKPYADEEMEKERRIEAKLREMERQIRYLKRMAKLYNDIDRKLARIYANKAKEATKRYKAFAKKHGYQWHSYRIEV